MNAGDAVFNHGGTWHGSGSNQTENAISCIIKCLKTSIRKYVLFCLGIIGIQLSNSGPDMRLLLLKAPTNN